MTSYNGHGEDCLCVPCMNADLSAHVLENFGEEALARINMDPAAKHTDTAVRTRYAQPGQRCGRGVVRLVSERQVRFIKSLLASRDTSNLTRLPGSEDIEKMSLAGARDLIERLLACPELPGTNTEPMATDKQVAFAKSLAERKGLTPSVDFTKATRKEISAIIESYLSIADAPKVDSTPALTPGIYELEGSYYRLQKARTGDHFYAKVLDRDAGDAWNYAPGVMSNLKANGRKLSLEECEALSLQLGGCCMCGKTLTATVNGVGPGARFIGPICQGKMGY